MSPPPAPQPAGLHLACLCAAWCRLCDGYASAFWPVAEELQARHPGLRAHWIDIEDDAELLGELDIETFPTLVLVDADGVRFAGPLTPQPETLRRVLLAALDAAPGGARFAPEVQAFAQRLRLRR